jgi:hypothetical protein
MQILNTAPRLVSFLAPSGLVMLTPLEPVTIAEGDIPAARAALAGALKPFVSSRELRVTSEVTRFDEAPGRLLALDNPNNPTTDGPTEPPELEHAEAASPAAVSGSSKRKT